MIISVLDSYYLYFSLFKYSVCQQWTREITWTTTFTQKKYVELVNKLTLFKIRKIYTILLNQFWIQDLTYVNKISVE